MPLNPANFNKTITFYNQGGDIKTMDYGTFKSNTSSIRVQNYMTHLPNLNIR